MYLQELRSEIEVLTCSFSFAAQLDGTSLGAIYTHFTEPTPTAPKFTLRRSTPDRAKTLEERVQKSKYIIDPRGSFTGTWDFVVVTALLFTCFVTPFEVRRPSLNPMRQCRRGGASATLSFCSGQYLHAPERRHVPSVLESAPCRAVSIIDSLL